VFENGVLRTFGSRKKLKREVCIIKAKFCWENLKDNKKWILDGNICTGIVRI
jgi:hypothetical protein